jgi:hypothetical protein
MNVDVSICIVSYQARDLLRDCLLSIHETVDSLSFEIIIVDNHSNDGTLAMLNDEFPDVRLLVNDYNTGYTRPNNQAMRESKGRYIVLLNPDTLVKPNAFAKVFSFLETHPEIGIVGPKVLNRDGTLQKQCRRSEARPWDTFCYFSGLSRLFPHDKRFAGYLMTYLDEDLTHEAEAVSGSCMMIRRQVIEQIGYQDEKFFAYQEDTDFCRRARLAGGYCGPGRTRRQKSPRGAQERQQHLSRVHEGRRAGSGDQAHVRQSVLAVDVERRQGHRLRGQLRHLEARRRHRPHDGDRARHHRGREGKRAAGRHGRQ